MSREREAQRQRALLGALFAADPARPAQAVAGPCSSTHEAFIEDSNDAHAGGGLANAGLAERLERLQRGLGAYRANAAGIAERAIAAAYPTFAALVGPQDCAALARALWRASSPVRGDLAQWGRDLPEFIAAQPDFAAWPWLSDCARLDAAVQRCESAADAVPEHETLALLAEQPPEALVLRLLPSVQLLASDWPVATLHAAHRPEHFEDGTRGIEGLELARAAIAERRGESVVVVRAAWRALPRTVDVPTFAWMRSLHANAVLSEALAQAGPGFDFNAWLLRALQQQWLWKAELAPAPGMYPQPNVIARRST